jgi:16S rRNA (guanine527-N7)-methyltransferase
VPADSPLTPEAFAELASVSRETLARLKLYVAMLEDWGARHNLVSRASMTDVWRRHVWDSAQLVPLVPIDAGSLVDLGSGAGFPGLVLAECLRSRGLRIALIESTGKKCRFLETVAARLGLAVEVRCARIEAAAHEPFSVVTARALAPMTQLLGYAERFWSQETLGLFLKGQGVDNELTIARESWKMSLTKHLSRSDASGAILVVRELRSATRP